MKSWEIWGREDEPVNSSWDGWTKLMTCNSFKSSGKPVGENTDEDNAYIAKGEKFDFPSGIPEVRYVRIKVLDSWSGQGYVQFSEFTFIKVNKNETSTCWYFSMCDMGTLFLSV